MTTATAIVNGGLTETLTTNDAMRLRHDRKNDYGNSKGDTDPERRPIREAARRHSSSRPVVESMGAPDQPRCNGGRLDDIHTTGPASGQRGRVATAGANAHRCQRRAPARAFGQGHRANQAIAGDRSSAARDAAEARVSGAGDPNAPFMMPCCTNTISAR